MLSRIRNALYALLIKSGIVLYLLPILTRLSLIIFPSDRRVNHRIKDESGCTIGATKVNGKLFPAFGVDNILKVKNLQVRDSDVFLCGYPKTGCHWTYEILRMLLTKKPDLSSFGKAIEGMMELSPGFILDSMPSPRVMNSHVYYDELPTEMKAKKNKIILTIRSCKDTVVSYYHHVKYFTPFYDYKGSFDNFFKLFIAGELEYGDYFDFYLDWQKVFTATQNHNEIFLLRYEDLKSDPVSKILEMAKFLDIDVSREFAGEVARSTDFSAMKTLRAGSLSAPLFRKGVVGDWSNWLSLDQSDQIDRLWKDKLSGTVYAQ